MMHSHLASMFFVPYPFAYRVYILSICTIIVVSLFLLIMACSFLYWFNLLFLSYMGKGTIFPPYIQKFCVKKALMSKLFSKNNCRIPWWFRLFFIPLWWEKHPEQVSEKHRYKKIGTTFTSNANPKIVQPLYLAFNVWYS